VSRYLVFRLFRAVLAILAIVTIVFFVARLTGDPATVALGSTASGADIQAYRHLMGWDQPLPVQYLTFLGNLARGEFGSSFYFRVPALELVLERVPATLELAVAGMAFACLIGVGLGLAAAACQGSLLDRGLMSLAVIGRSLPIFWLALLLVMAFAVNMRLLPVSGRDGWSSLVLPALSLGLVSAAEIARLARSAMVEVLSQDFVRTARAKGLPRHVVLGRHALRNALNPILTVVSLQFASLLGGAVVTETIFAWPGLGRLTVNAIASRDFPVIQASVFLLAVWFAVTNLIVDLLYPVLDPRIRRA
jgi:ABC-type dipeptide/oligopeptide/nickel transport system permease component